MPIDAAIPLSVRAPQIDSPLQVMGQVLSLQQLHQQIQQGQALEDERRQTIAQRQMLIAQNQKVDQLMATAFKEDPDTGVATFDRPTFEQGLVRSGMGHLYPTLAEHLDKLDQSAAKIAGERRTLLARSIFAVQQAGNTPDAVTAAAAYLTKNGAITRDHLQPVLAAVAQDPSPENIGAVMTKLGSGLPEYRELVNAEEKRKLEIREKTADVQIKERQAQPRNPADYQAILDTSIPSTDKANAALRARTQSRLTYALKVGDTKAADKALEDMSQELRAMEVAKNTVPFKIAVQTGGMNYGPNAQGEPNPTAKAIAEYRLPPLTSFAMAKPAGQMLMQEVARLNPAYDATLYPQRQKTRVAYTTGTEGQQLNALNTAIMHMDLLAEAADALHNGEFKPGNAAFNKIKDLFGSATPNNYDTIKEFLDGEVGAVIKKGVATEGEMGRLEKKGGTASSPEQLQGYIKNAVRILGGKAAVLNDKYHAVMGATDPFSAISPRSEAVLVKHGFNPAEFGAPNSSSSNTTSPVPDLKGVQMGHGRTFTAGPFKGQTWTIGADGQPKRVK